MCKNDIRHRFNVYTSKEKNLFLYVLQYLNINHSFVCLFKLLHFISGECVEDYQVLFFHPSSSRFRRNNFF